IRSNSAHDLLRLSNRGWFTRGASHDEVPDELHEYLSNDNVFMRCIRDAARFQLVARNAHELDELAKSLDDPPLDQPLRRVNEIGFMSQLEVKEELIERVPEAEEFTD